MESEEEAKKSVELLNKKIIDNREINVEIARPREEKPPADPNAAPANNGSADGGAGRYIPTLSFTFFSCSYNIHLSNSATEEELEHEAVAHSVDAQGGGDPKLREELKEPPLREELPNPVPPVHPAPPAHPEMTPTRPPGLLSFFLSILLTPA
jgi:hypothetical protein